MHTPNMWLESLHQDIRRDFKNDIWYEEYGQGNVGLLAHQAKIFRKIHSERVGYVNSTITRMH
jgi:hypothetical protein